jgi:hypothetical protein
VAADIVTVSNRTSTVVPLAQGVILPVGGSHVYQQNDLTNAPYVAEHLAKAVKAGLVAAVTYEGENLTPLRLRALGRAIHAHTHDTTLGIDPLTGLFPGVDYRKLLYLADGVGGPMEGFASGHVRETLPTGSPFPTVIIWWTNAAKLFKLVQKDITFTSIFLPTQVKWTLFQADGVTVLRTVTDVITYSGIFETDRTRTVV